MTMACSPIARTPVIAEDARLAAQISCALALPGPYLPVVEGPALSSPGPDRGARAPEQCGRKSEAEVDLNDRAFEQCVRRSDREIGQPPEAVDPTHFDDGGNRPP